MPGTPRRSPDPSVRPRAVGAAAVLIVLALTAPARAQVAFSATASSNYVYRGVSLSDGKPALSLSIAYDHGAGAYAGAALIGALTERDGVQGLGHAEYLGYAGRLGRSAGWDAGVMNTHVVNYDYGKYKYDFTEIYGGLRRGPLNAYLYFSPNYFAPGVKTLYARIAGSIHPARPWRLFAHLGALSSLGGGGYPRFREQYDLGLGVARDIGIGEVQLAFTTRGPDPVYLAGRPQRRQTLTLSLTHVF